MINEVSEINHGTSYDQCPSQAGKTSPDNPCLVLMDMKLVHNGKGWHHHRVSLALKGSSSKKNCMQLTPDSLDVNTAITR